MRNFKNFIPRNILAALTFFVAFLLVNFFSFWLALLLIALLVYCFFAESHKQVRFSVILAFGIVLFNFFISSFLSFLVGCDVFISSNIFTLFSSISSIGLITLAVVSFFIVNKKSERSDI